MRNRLFLCVMLTAMAVTVQNSCSAQTNEAPEVQLKAAAKKLIVSGLDQESLQLLFRYSRNGSSDPQLRSRTMAIFALASLVKGDTNLFERARLSHLANYPADKDFIPIKLNNCIGTCSDCAGFGYTETENNCTVCQGSKSCTKCKGTGKWQIASTFDSRKSENGRRGGVLSCGQCNGTGRCPACNGATMARKNCPTCNGTGTLFNIPKSKIAEKYKSLLSDIIAAIETEENLSEQIGKAKAEPALELRIRAFEKLLKTIGGRPERVEIERWLLADQNVLKQQLAAEAAAKQQQERELSTLRSLRHSKNPQAALVTLREYLAANPNSPYRLEIQSIRDETAAAIESNREKKKLLYAGGAALLLLLGLSCININYFKYSLFQSSSADGAKRRKPGADLYTDPLSLTAKDSRARVKNKTARIPIPDNQDLTQ